MRNGKDGTRNMDTYMINDEEPCQSILKGQLKTAITILNLNFMLSVKSRKIQQSAERVPSFLITLWVNT